MPKWKELKALEPFNEISLSVDTNSETVETFITQKVIFTHKSGEKPTKPITFLFTKILCFDLMKFSATEMLIQSLFICRENTFTTVSIWYKLNT